MPPGNTCATCRHWKPFGHLDGKPAGVCELITYNTDTSDVPAMIDDDDATELLTLDTFGCTLHEVKT